MGIKYILISKELAEKNKLLVDYGALVIRENLGEPPIVKGSVADKVGIKEFDIILECEKEKITFKNPLRNILQKFEIGQVVELKILREKKEIVIKVKLQEKK